MSVVRALHEAASSGSWSVALAVGVAAWVGGGGSAGGRLSTLAGPVAAQDDGGGPVPVRTTAGSGSLRRRVPWPPRNRQDTAGTDLPAVVGELAQLLGAGVAPASAWRHGAAGTRDDPVGAVVRSAADAAASGRSVADQLDRGAREVPGRAGSDLRALAGAWRVVEVTGAPAAGILGRVAAGLRDGADVRDARTAAMAAPLATARLLAALPVLGLFLGQLMGASPVQVLLGSPPGRVSAVVGLVFAVAGAAWTRRLLRSASAPG